MSSNAHFVVDDDEPIDLLGDTVPSNLLDSQRDAFDPFSDANGLEQQANFNMNPFEDQASLIFTDDEVIDNDIPSNSIDHNPFTVPQQESSIRGMYNQFKGRIGLSNYSTVTPGAMNHHDDGPTDHRPSPDSYESSSSNFFDLRRLFSRHKDEENDGPRIIYVNDKDANSKLKYVDNHISTTKYNIFTFLPKFLFEQFSKYANLFFLFTSIIQQVPSVTPTNRYTTIGTLCIVLFVSAVKEVSEDYKRASSDSELNSSRVLVLDQVTGDYKEKRWINLHVGDIIKVENGDPIPADLVILSTSEPEGLCYIETANLDGETNLKIKQAKEETANLIDSHSIVRCQGRVMSERPNSSLYTYEGTLQLNGNDIPLSPDQLLLRGASLRNTNWIQGIVIFTGHETKLMRNATATPIKKTDVERIINLQIIALFGILIFLSIVSSLGDVITLKTQSNNLSYLYQEGTNKVGLFFLDILTYWILYSNLVPISLFVTVEIIKYYQAFLIASDLDMYYEETDTATVVRTSSLVEELGQIKYVFSDKTGTLTRNIMEFRTCSIAGKCYIGVIPEDRQATLQDGVEIGYYTFDQMKQDILNNDNGRGKVINEFFTLLSACHTVIPEIVEGTDEIKYQAASPDEGALVEGAALLGYKFHTRKPSSITINISGKDETYELLNICEFNSTRKRMSAIFKCPDGKIRLYVKGADSVILERLSNDNDYTDATLRHLEEFAVEGLRTLCVATRIISDSEYQDWSKIYNEASVSLDDRSQKLDDAAELIEKDLFLLGATAIEDKLQDGVPETISILQEAGIKIWVLTGDRQETAINVGMSCKLLSEDMNLLIINEETKDDTCQNMMEKLKILNSNELSEEDKNSLALVIDGKSLGFALEHDLEDMFLAIGTICTAVICCRVSPLQKALVVKLVKRKEKALLLAIGDGANDVSMIQAAHVGVGINGMEGTQAARSADFAIGQFKYLKRLLLVHGSWSYQRISLAILYSFYKNITLYMCQFWYAFSNGFSGQSVVESWSLTLYNVFFVALPPFVIGVFDQYISANSLLQYPKIYTLGQNGNFFNVTIFWSWAVNGFYHSAVIYLCIINIYKYGNELPNGLIADHWVVGVTIYTVCLLTSLGKAALVSTQWTKFTLVAIPGSFILWLIVFPIYAAIAPRVNVSKEYYGIVAHVYGSGIFWFTVIAVPSVCLMRDLFWKVYKRTWTPEFHHQIQKLQKNQVQSHRPKFSSFQKTIRKVRQVQRMKKQRGFAFSQVEGQENIVRKYDTTKQRGIYGELN
ncbi:aminophospholipid-translocating P4-type ATPase [Martiniozyma asiatica (nom. inval.)]|nr:aminophospholipid-translocating P4-type ATPase [Martiniozyma asiatica]